jgi:signal transduction histidine kinase
MELSKTEDKEALNRVLKETFDMVPAGKQDKALFYLQNLLHRYGYLGFATLDTASEEDLAVYSRFIKEFEQTFAPFPDLHKAEAVAREALKLGACDRVRNEIAGMRNPEDLDRIIPLIWEELKALEIPFIRCGVLIVNEDKKKIQTHLSSWNGKSLGIFDLPFENEEISIGVLKNWQNQSVYRDYWDKNTFLRFMKELIDSGRINNEESFQGAPAPPESLYLHFVSFKQGMLYVGNTSPLSESVIDLVKSLADAFSIAFARYEDFNKLEEAKNNTEKTLEDLKAAQKQLIHAEKMASLGDLTAGIAHEIQNPLNFIKNFSEINSELVDELEEEIKNGNLEEIKAIAKNIKENQHKINNHGKRAESIVKGMLLHSRESSGKKELTDIKALADEFLRVSYHKFLAKDKSFHAVYKLVADESLPKIKVVPQDIGRVLLNLINNAFYTVHERSLKKEHCFRPKVVVSIKGRDEYIEIVVNDNGNGIPEDIRDKIFQPFFTTKPTGLGTGLGLSISYDIIKAHGGELKVEAKPGKRTEFIIQIPFKAS